MPTMTCVRRAASAMCLMLCVTCASCSHASPDDAPTLPRPQGVPRGVVPGHVAAGVGHPPPRSAHDVATVLLFIAPDCPISNAYAPEINRLVDAYRFRGVGFLAVHADPRVTEDAARRHAREFGLKCAVLLDPRQDLARHTGATVTPEAAVLDRGGQVVYRGRIDDLFYGFGKRRQQPTTRELRDALDAVLAGRAVAKASAPAIGCEIPPP